MHSGPEGLTWIGTALGVGVAGGSAIAGPIIDSQGSHAGFLVAVGAGALAGHLPVAGVPVIGPRFVHQLASG